MRIKLIIACFLIAGAVLGCWLIKYQHDGITALEAKKTELEATIEKARQANVEANKQIEKLREVKNTDTKVADWYNLRIASNVLMLLRQRYGAGN